MEQVRELVAATSGDTEAHTRNYAIIVTLFCCGLRISELCGLDWSDLDLDCGQAWLKSPRENGNAC